MKQKYCGLEREIRGRKSNCTAGVKGQNIAGIVRMRNRKEAHMTKRKYNQKEVEQARRGRIYINREDARIFVRKSGLYAWTMNLGNPASWIIMGLELLVVLLITRIFFF